MIGQGQHTICDLNDITTGSSAPTTPVVNQLWCDTSITPNQLKKWNGSAWEIVNEVKVGGRNLLKNSGNFRTSGWNSGVQNNGGGWTIETATQYLYNGNPTLKTLAGLGLCGTNDTYLKLSNGVEYTYSAMVLCNESAVGSNNQPLHYHVGYNNASEGKINVIKYDTTLVANIWKKIYITFKLTGDADSFRPYIYWGSNGTRIFYIANIKLELGNTATDWTPAQEDTTADILTAQTAANTANAVIAQISNDDILTPSEKQQALREWLAVVAEKTLYLNQASGLGINPSAYSAAYDALSSFIGTNLNDVTTTWSMGVGYGSLFRNRFSAYYTERTNLLNAVSTKINTSATNANNKIDGLKVGGRNYAIKSKFGYQALDTDGFYTKTGTNGENYITVQLDNVTEAGEYTLSFLTKRSANVTNEWCCLVYGNTYSTVGFPLYVGIGFNAGDTALMRVSFKFSINNSQLGNGLNIRFDNYGSNNGLPATLYVKDVMLVKGNVSPESYTEAPEDIQARTDAATNTAIGAVKVGGRNLIIGTSKSTTVTTAMWVTLPLSSQLEVGKEYILGGTYQFGEGTIGVIQLFGSNGRISLPINTTFIATLEQANCTSIGFANQTGVGVVTVINPKLEAGNKSTDYTEAPEDVTASIKLTSDAIAAIYSDNVLTPNDKILLKRELASIATEYSELRYEAEFHYGIATDSLDDSYTYLINYITPFLENVTTSAPIDGTYMQERFETYASEKAAMKELISNAANAKIAATDYLKEAFKNDDFKPSGQSFSILWSKLMLMRDSVAPYKITGGMSGLSSDPVGLFIGGSYEGAQQSATNPTLVAGIDRKDGSGHRAFGAILWDAFGKTKIGNFIINGATGAFTGYEGLYERLRIGTQSITSLTELLSGSGTWVRESSDYLIPSTFAGTIFQSYDGVTKIRTSNNSSEVTKYSSLTIPVATNIKLYSGGAVSHSLDNMTGLVFIGTSERFLINGTLYTPTSGGLNVYLAAGTYTIKYLISASYTTQDGVSAIDYLSNTTAAYIAVQSVAPSRTEIGANGFLSFWSAALYFYYDKINGLKVRGATDIPAGLGGGNVGSGGIYSQGWGLSYTSSKSSYTVTINHNITDTKFTVNVIPRNSFTWYLSSISASSSDTLHTGTIVIVCSTTGAVFDYVILRTPY